MSNAAWQQKPDNSDFTSAQSLYKEAVVAKLWVYRVDKKVWYTPEEFKDTYINNSSPESMKMILHYFKIIDPQAGLKQRLDFMKKTSEEIEIFTKRVIEYYNKPERR
jgi:hypothetical protein